MKTPWLIIIFIASTFPVLSQGVSLGNSISFLHPVKEFGTTHGQGFAIKGNVEFRIPGPVNFTAEGGWNRWQADPRDGSEIPPKVAWSILGGVKLNIFGPLYAEGRAGYYFGDIDSFAFLPAAGLRVRRMDLNLGYQMLNDNEFVDMRICIFWGRL